MTRPAAMVPVEREIVRWCHSGLDVSALQRQVLRSLRRVMTVEAAFFATADPETLLFTGAYVEEPLESATPMFLANEFGSDDVNKFAALATSATRVATLDNATHHVRPSSPRSRDIMQPLGLGDELRAALVAGSECWGYLCLHRDDSGLGFTSAEAALLARLGPHIAHALRQALLLRHPAPPGDATAPGVIVMTEDFSPVAVTAEAEHLLSRITDGRSAGLPLPLPSTASRWPFTRRGATPRRPPRAHGSGRRRGHGSPCTRRSCPAGTAGRRSPLSSSPWGAGRPSTCCWRRTDSAHGRCKWPGWCSVARRPGPSSPR
jgi:hypothetical protein